MQAASTRIGGLKIEAAISLPSSVNGVLPELFPTIGSWLRYSNDSCGRRIRTNGIVDLDLLL